MLAEHAETVHSQFVNEKKDLRDVFSDFFLKLSNNFEDIVVSKDGVHSDDDFADDDENVFLDLNVDRVEKLWVLDSDGVKGVNDDVEENVVHALGVLNAWIGKGEKDFPQ